MWAAVAVCAVGVIIGMIVLWPGRANSGSDPLGLDGDPVTARVTSQAVEPCSYDPLLGCRQIELIPGSGAYEGERLSFEQSLNSPIRDGDSIVVDIVLLVAAYVWMRCSSRQSSSWADGAESALWPGWPQASS